MTRSPCRTPGCTGTALNRPTCNRCRTRLNATTRTAPPADSNSRREVAARFTDLGLSSEEVARILGVTPRTIHRWRAQRRTTTGAE